MMENSGSRPTWRIAVIADGMNSMPLEGVASFEKARQASHELAVEDLRVLKMRSARAIDMAQLGQHRPLLGKNQQQRECKRRTNPIHVTDGGPNSLAVEASITWKRRRNRWQHD
jgi:hypothetical protein